MPAIAIEGHLVAGWSSQVPAAVNYQGIDKDLAQRIFKSLQPDLCLFNWLELQRWCEAVAKTDDRVASLLDWSDLLKQYHLDQDPRFTKVLKILPGLPGQFQHWLLQKRVNAKEAASLLFFSDTTVSENSKHLELLTKIGSSQLSKSEGLMAMDLGFEILEMGAELPVLSALPENQWLGAIKAKRFQDSEARSQKDQEWLKPFCNAKSLQGQWQRRGDVTGLEVKLFARKPEELAKHQELVTKMHEAWVDHRRESESDACL